MGSGEAGAARAAGGEAKLTKPKPKNPPRQKEK